MRWTRRDWTVWGVIVLLAAALFFALFTAIAEADGYKHKDTTTTTSTVPEETTTTDGSTTTTKPRQIEVCRDDQIIVIDWKDKLESDEVIWHEFDRRDCQPPRTPTSTTIPEVVITFPPYSVGYICPGTDGVVYELPWGTYEDMWPTPESAKLYGCPTTTIPTEYVTTPPRVTIDTLPFTGIPVWAWVVAAVIMLGGGVSLVRSIEEGDE